MKTGPKPTPNALRTPVLLLPDLIETPPNPPASLDQDAAVQWWETAQVLIDRRTLTKGDLPTLENYVRLSGMISKATISADWRLVDKLIGSQTRLARELGCTPSSRVSIQATPASEGFDDLERFKRDDTDLEPCRGERLRDTESTDQRNKPVKEKTNDRI